MKWHRFKKFDFSVLVKKCRMRSLLRDCAALSLVTPGSDEWKEGGVEVLLEHDVECRL